MVGRRRATRVPNKESTHEEMWAAIGELQGQIKLLMWAVGILVPMALLALSIILRAA